MDQVIASLYPEVGAGGFSRYDGTLQFYGRINALLTPDMTVIDLGAGRGAQFEDSVSFRRGMIGTQGKVKRVIGIDVDPAVNSNTHIDEARLYDGGRLPLDDEEVDLIFCDWVLEHIEQPEIFATEVGRVLKPGGWFCARTPEKYSLIAIASRMVPNRHHAKSLEKIQAGERKAEDVFPAHYRLNSLGAVKRHFPRGEWDNFSYTWSPDPSYHFGRPAVARAVSLVQYLKRPFGGENLLVFVRKRQP